MELFEREEFPTATFVIVCDRSQSMQSSGALAELDRFLPTMVGALQSFERVRETAMLSIVGFSAQAEVLLPLSSIAEAGTRLTPRLAPGQTNFAPPLEAARGQLERMRIGARRCYRPVVFFLSDGYHNVGDARAWQEQRARLVDPGFPRRPTIVTFGLGGCDMDTLAAIASAPDLCRHYEGEPVAAVQTILQIVLRTTLRLSRPNVREAEHDRDDLVGRILAFRYDDDRDDESIHWVA